MNSLVGYTGFVGSNLYEKGCFDRVYNSQNIEEAYGTEPDLLVYAGLRAEKYLANNAPEKDFELIEQAQENIKRIGPKKLVLISTVDVFKNPNEMDETSEIQTEGLHAYGYNRYLLECWVREHYPDALIIRLPGLFGKNIKKNFIYDFIHRIPFMLKEEKFMELSEKQGCLETYYQKMDNGFYKVKPLAEEEQKVLKEIFVELGFSALNFTDSRASYQFYNLSRLWDDMNLALEANMKLWHPATEPVTAGELYEYLTGEVFVNELPGSPVNYDYHTIYSEIFGGEGQYICSKKDVMEQIKEFVHRGR